MFFSQKLNFTVRNVYPLTLITCPRLKQTKSENNSLSSSSVFLQIVAFQILYSPIFEHYLWLLQIVAFQILYSPIFEHYLWLLQTVAFQIPYSPIFEHYLWLLSRSKLKQAFIQPYSFIFYPFFKSGMILTIYHKYSKSFIENIPLPASYGMGIYWNNFLIQIQSFLLIILIFQFCNEKLCIYF